MSTTTELLNVPEAAGRRHSVRAYTDEPVAPEMLDEVLRVASLAPSAFNLQPWRFVVVRDPEVKEQLAMAANGQRQVRSAPAVIVLYTDMRDVLEHVDETLHPALDAARRAASRESLLRSFGAMAEAEREAWGAEQGHIALGFLLLAAEAHGLQTSAMAGFDPAAVGRLLGLPEHVRIPALVAIGHGAEEGFPRHRHPLERIVRAA